MRNQIRISFVIPHLNSNETLPNCLAAIRKQSFAGDIEIIVVDNGSQVLPDAVTKQYGAKLVKAMRKGPSVARNRGLKLAQGEWIAFIDADVILQENWAQTCLGVFAKHNWIDCVQSPIVPNAFQPESFICKYRKLSVGRATNGTFSHLQGAHQGRPIVNSSAFIVRASRLRSLKIQFNEDFLRAEDTDFTRRLFFKGAHFALADNTFAEVFDRRSPLAYLLRGYYQNYYKIMVNDFWFKTPFQFYKIHREFFRFLRSPSQLEGYSAFYAFFCSLAPISYYFLHKKTRSKKSEALTNQWRSARADPRNQYLLNIILQTENGNRRVFLDPFARIFLLVDHAVILLAATKENDSTASPYILSGDQFADFLRLAKNSSESTVIRRDSKAYALAKDLIKAQILVSRT